MVDQGVAGANAAGANREWDSVRGFWTRIGDATLKYQAWGDGFEHSRLLERDGGFAVWYEAGGAAAMTDDTVAEPSRPSSRPGRVDNESMSGVLFFDGACGMCTRSRDLLLKFNRTGDLRTEPLQSHGTADRLGIPDARLLDSVRWLDASGEVYAGAEAANAALSSAIGTRVPLLVYRLPGIRWAQDSVYRWVAAHRYRFPGTTPYCESHPRAC